MTALADNENSVVSDKCDEGRRKLLDRTNSTVILAIISFLLCSLFSPIKNLDNASMLQEVISWVLFIAWGALSFISLYYLVKLTVQPYKKKLSHYIGLPFSIGLTGVFIYFTVELLFFSGLFFNTR
ncbi:MAG: hypothetical protein ACYS8W_12525 [Planctomycetota bacterium]|jgi:hypothetical protein